MSEGARTSADSPQQTLARPTEFRGVGLHTGHETTFKFLPAPPDHGIRIVRVDLPAKPEIQVCPENARLDVGALRRTVIQAGEAEIHTVEHVLSALAGLGIDNVRIEANGLEAPEPSDGSARAVVEVLKAAGLEAQARPRRPFVIEEPIALADGDTQILGLPHDGLRLSFTIQYANPLIGTQHLSLEVDPEVYAREIAPARTFALWEDVEKLRAAGMIQGGSLKNAVVVKGSEVLSEEGLRYPDEFVRHKLLDLLGDLSLLGRPIRGHIHAIKSGHGSNVRFVQRLAESQRGPALYDRLLGTTHFDINQILNIMPHRYPMLLVDRILLLEPARRVIGLKSVTINEPFFVGHFPGHPIMPGVLILEAMAQAGGVLLLHTVDDPSSKLMYFLGIDNARFRRPVMPGDQMIFDLTMGKLKGRICRMDGKAYVRGALVAEAEFMSTIVDR